MLALALGYILKFPVKTAAAAGVIADADIIFSEMGLGFPFIHRGFLHTPIILGVMLIAIYFATRRPDICAGFGAGFLSHLLIDTFNPTGIMWLYPLPTFFTLDLVTYSNPIANWGIALWSAAFILVLNPNFITKLNPRKLRMSLKGIK